MSLTISGAMGFFWISLGFIFYVPTGILASYSPNGDSVTEGLTSAGFNADLGLWLVFWGLAIFVVLICSIRTNITFIVLFTILDAGLFIFAASHFQIAGGNLDTAIILQNV